MQKITAKLAWGALLAGAFAGMGCGSDDDFNGVVLPPTVTVSPTATVTGGPYLVPPQASNDTYSVVGNGQLTVAAAQGVLANDQPNQTPAVVQNRPSKGQLALNADGSFTYTPNQGVGNTTDTFTYTLTNSSGTATGTVTIGIGNLAFFVNNQAASGGNGQQATPFRTLAEAQAAAAGVSGAQITVARGDGTSAGYNSPISLSVGQSLVGQDPANQPTLSGTVTLAGGNRVANLRLNGVNGVAINGAGAQDGTISGVTVENGTGTSISLANATGTWSIDGCTVTNPGVSAVFFDNSSGILTWTISNSNFSGGGTSLFTIDVNTSGSATETATVQGCTFTGLEGAEAVGALFQTTGTNNKLTMSNNTVNGGGNSLRGLEVATRSTSNFLGIITGNTITGCTAEGIQMSIGDNSVARARFTSNRTTGNQTNAGININNVSGSPSFGAVFQSNTSDFFDFGQNNLGTFQVEQLSQFNTAAGNTGTVSASTGVQDAGSGTLNIPNS